ncbi:MAG: hypothetical protein ACOX6U_02885 [Oscillospiraceae bacterium]
MKRFRRVTSILISAALMLGCVGFSASAEQSNLTPAEQYAVYVDSLDWASYETHDEMVEAAQIPVNLLNQMTTNDLVDALMNYPLLIDLNLFNTKREGFERVYQDFNGLRALLEKDDGAMKLVERYENTSIANGHMRSTNLENAIIVPRFLESLLAQNEIISTLSETQESELLKTVEEKCEQKSASPFYSGTINTFYETLAENSGVTPLMDYTTIVLTPKQTAVQVIWREYEFTSYEITEINRQTEMAYPNATRVKNASRRYNCHSYAWYSTSDYYIMDEPQQVKYMSDGSYVKTTVANGRKAYYYAGSHSAIVTTVRYDGTYRVTGKWGTESGVYEHAPNYGPYDWHNPDHTGDPSILAITFWRLA